MNDLQPVEDQEIQIIQVYRSVFGEVLAFAPVGIDTPVFRPLSGEPGEIFHVDEAIAGGVRRQPGFQLYIIDPGCFDAGNIIADNVHRLQIG